MVKPKKVTITIHVEQEDGSTFRLDTNLSYQTISELGPSGFQNHVKWLFQQAGVVPTWI
jgi:hypothetical protein